MDVIVPTKLAASVFTRASIASFYNSTAVLSYAAVNVPRANYDPTNLSNQPTPLFESNTTNLTPYPENFLFGGDASGVATSVNNATCEYNCSVAPDGRFFADKLVETASNTVHGALMGGFSAGVNTTYSVFVKAGERTKFRWDAVPTGGSGITDSWVFDLVAATVTRSTTGATTAIITPVGNGWYRCSMSGASALIDATNFNMMSGTNVIYTGNRTSGMYLWGFQAETGLVPTSYIPPTYTFTSRAGTTATYINSAGNITSAAANVARMHYIADNLSLAPRLLFEPAATNLCLQSSAFNTSPWVAQAGLTITANSTIAPDGTAVAETITDPSAVANAYVGQDITVANNSAGYVLSVFVLKTVGATTFPCLELALGGGSPQIAGGVVIDTNAGAIQRYGTSTSVVYGRVDSCKDYWRISVGIYNNNAGNTVASCKVYPAVNTNGSTTFNVATTGSAIIWGAQLETTNTGFGTFGTANLTRTSYIATTTVAVTRNADIISATATDRAADTVDAQGMYYTNIPENDFPVWSGATTYGIDVSGSNSVIYKHVKYASLQASNTNHQPDISPTWWSVIGSTNAYALIDTQVGTQTSTNSGNHILSYFTGPTQSSISLINVSADYITVKVFSGGVQMYTNTVDFTGGSSGVPITDYTITGLTPYINGVISLDVYADNIKPAIGNFVVGTKYYLGSTETSPTIGIVDYSVKTIDAFGNPTLTKRGYAKRMNTKQLMDDSTVDTVARLMSQIRATPCVWNANTTMRNLTSNAKTSLIVYGYYKDWEISVDYKSISYLTCSIEGLI